MTLANKITITRILLIPVFVLLAVYYGSSVESGTPQEVLRWWTILVFVTASATDGIDGWVARHFGQRSRLGAVLDPIADKGLLLSAIITLSVSPWQAGFPLWFPVLVIARDAVILVGCAVLSHLDGHLDVKPTLAGKIATALQMTAVAWIMLHLPYHHVPVFAAGAFTLYSGTEYLLRGIDQLRRHDQQTPARHSKP
ncbi:MAG: CDP-alcohol phosphatidyltransferase family protein [Terrimicrobiaceae bacterium]